MAESLRERVKKERERSRRMDAGLRALFAAPGDDDLRLRERLEALAQEPRFAEFTWFWGPRLAERNRVLFRPFILSHFSSLALDAEGKGFDAWKRADTGPLLARWFAAADAADDVELTRRLYAWQHAKKPWKEVERAFRADAVARFSAASSPAARFTALAKIDSFISLDAATALELYRIDAARSRAFILGHLPYFGWLGEKLRDWDALLAAAREGDPDFYFDLYRRIVDEKRWREDVLECARNVEAAADLDAELERRHPRTAFATMADVFHELVRARQRDVVPYVLRHVGSVFPRWGFAGTREAKGLQGLLATANREGWLDLWAALLRTGASKELFDAEVERLVRSKTAPDSELEMRLTLIAGQGREAHFPGLSFAQVQRLEEKTALQLYGRFPRIVRGPFRLHVAPSWHSAYPRLVRAALERGDTELVDFFAARAGIQVVPSGRGNGWGEAIDLLSAHFEALAEDEFVRRAASALSRMPAYAVWNYDELLRGNALARLLFERSTALYLADPRAVRDLLESPQIHVQVLAFRILGRDEPRARQIGAANADLLQATLFRPLQRRTRLVAFKALENAAEHDEATGRYLLARMRDALGLPEKHYPTEKLIGMVARVLRFWPALRSAREVPVVYGEAGA
jgi:hypothetical protein